MFCLIDDKTHKQAIKNVKVINQNGTNGWIDIIVVRHSVTQLQKKKKDMFFLILWIEMDMLFTYSADKWDLFTSGHKWCGLRFKDEVENSWLDECLAICGACDVWINIQVRHMWQHCCHWNKAHTFLVMIGIESCGNGSFHCSVCSK